MKIREIMHKASVLKGDLTVLDIARFMSEKNIGSVLIRDRNRIGIVTERDILRKVVSKQKNPSEVKVTDIMTELDKTINAEADIEKASQIFNKYHIRRLPVVENKAIIGMVTTRNLAKNIRYNRIRKMQQYKRGYSQRL